MKCSELVEVCFSENFGEDVQKVCPVTCGVECPEINDATVLPPQEITTTTKTNMQFENNDVVDIDKNENIDVNGNNAALPANNNTIDDTDGDVGGTGDTQGITNDGGKGTPLETTTSKSDSLIADEAKPFPVIALVVIIIAVLLVIVAVAIGVNYADPLIFCCIERDPMEK